MTRKEGWGSGKRESVEKKGKRKKKESGRKGDTGGRERERKKEDEKKEEIKIRFWNVAGIKGKDEEFWERIEEWDVIGRNKGREKGTGVLERKSAKGI